MLFVCLINRQTGKDRKEFPSPFPAIFISLSSCLRFFSFRTPYAFGQTCICHPLLLLLDQRDARISHAWTVVALHPPWTDHTGMSKNRHLTQESIRFWALAFKYTMEDRAFFLLGFPNRSEVWECC